MAIERKDIPQPQQQEAQPASFFNTNGETPQIDRYSCGLEGVGTRPEICPNNPWREETKDNHRPRVCGECPTNENVWQIALDVLPVEYILFKQGKEIDKPKLKLTENLE